MRVALYGGAFDPIHVGHLFVISSLLNSDLIDEVWILPSGDRPDKKYTAKADDRLQMVQDAVKESFREEEHVSVRDYHCGNLGVGPSTLELVEYCRKTYPKNHFFVGIGRELVRDLPSWFKPERLKKEVDFLAVDRGGQRDIPSSDFKVTHIKNQSKVSLTVSSSAVRLLLNRNKSVAGLLSPAVQGYIKDKKMYESLK